MIIYSERIFSEISNATKYDSISCLVFELLIFYEKAICSGFVRFCNNRGGLLSYNRGVRLELKLYQSSITYPNFL